MTNKKKESSGEDSSPEFPVYLCVKKDENGEQIKSFMLTNALHAAKKYAAGEDLSDLTGDENADEDEKVDDQELTPIAALCESLFSKFDEALSPYHKLIELTSFMRGGMRRMAIDRGICGAAKKNGTLIEEKENIEIYGIGNDVHEDMSKEIKSMNELDAGFSILPGSILLSLVATFDSLIGDAITELLSLMPEKLQNSDKTITYRDLFNIGDLDSVRDRFIQGEVDKLLRGSHEEQVAYIEKLIETKIVGHYSRWPNFLEIFDRRNRIAHASGLIGQDYIDRSKDIGFPTDGMVVGELVRLNAKYLHKVADVLLEFGITLAFVTWRKLAEQSQEEAYETLNETAYSFITQQRYQLAAWLLDFALHRQNRRAKEVTLRRMFVNLANAYKKMGKKEQAEKVLQELDWSAASGPFQIALAALSEDVEKVVSALPLLAHANELSIDQFREWPVFDWVREDERVIGAFKEAFGVPLVPERIETGTAAGTDIPNQEPTLH